MLLILKSQYLKGLFLLFPFLIFAQNNDLNIEGLIVDETGYGVPYAAIGIPSKFIGSSSNEDGAFKFSVTKENITDTLEVSSIGYKTYKIKIEDYINLNKKKVVLIEDIVSLSEVKILASKDYVKLALKNLRKTMLSISHEMDVLYRRFSSENGSSRFLVEHYIKIYDGEPLSPEFYDVQVAEIRKSVDYRFIKKKQNFHSVNLLSRENPIREGIYREDYVWKKIGDSSYDGEDIVIIEGRKKEDNSQFLKLYIGINTYSIYKIETSHKNAVYIYKKDHEGKLYLSYHYRSSESMEPITAYMQKLLHAKTNQIPAAYKHEVIVLHLETNRRKIDVNPFGAKGKDMGDLNLPYNANFWNHLSLPPESKFYKKSVLELESVFNIPLEQQFKVIN